jgi:hypothetical protein
MTLNQSAVLKARRTILATASGILSGAVAPIEGACMIAASRFSARMEVDPDILPFVGIDFETDALPLGKDRRHWQAQALADLQPRIEEAQRWARELGSQYCQKLLARSASVLQWPD